ncbi:hypothetical protein KY320_02750, partial [Candidatus Woesearchaeota archaeon]|nr:hypothetical protein [Candidatus Woesearchaeota archaeon]
MSKLTAIFKDSKVLILVAVIVSGIFAIAPRPFATGVVVKSVAKDKAQDFAGLEIGKEKVIEINSQPVESVEDFYSLLSIVPENVSVR